MPRYPLKLDMLSTRHSSPTNLGEDSEHCEQHQRLPAASQPSSTREWRATLGQSQNHRSEETSKIIKSNHHPNTIILLNHVPKCQTMS